jgi:cyclophilin family peptidyl-prolyl cis-trans isomerase
MSFRFRSSPFACSLICLALSCGSGSIHAQESDSAETATEAGDDAGAQPATSAAEATTSAAEQFDAKFVAWKSVLREMRALKARYVLAEPDEGVEIERRWHELIELGMELVPELRAAGIKAYAEAPGQNRELEQFLLKLLADDLALDRYENAAELSTAMINDGCEIATLKEAAGVAAFAVNNMKVAQKNLTAAQEAGVLTEAGAKYLDLLPEYTKFWEVESSLRAAEAEADDLPRVRIETTKGVMVAELFENEAPDTVGNFISLVDQGYYNGLKFHRVLAGFMAQGGCPLGDGSGGPDYNIRCECYEPNHRKHFRGSLSMAHAGRDTGGSQFFLTFVPTEHLNGQHTVFGRVTEGMKVLGNLQRTDPDAGNADPDKIVKMEVIRKREHEYKPNKAN